MHAAARRLLPPSLPRSRPGSLMPRAAALQQRLAQLEEQLRAAGEASGQLLLEKEEQLQLLQVSPPARLLAFGAQVHLCAGLLEIQRDAELQLGWPHAPACL